MDKEEFLKYRGISPFPGDFDSFWDNEIRKADIHFNNDLNYELVEKNFNIPFARCYDLYFNSMGNARIYSKILIPDNVTGKIPFLLIFHGYHGQSADWSRYIGYVASGTGVVLMDVRGQAGKSQDNSIFEGITVKGHIIRGVSEGREKLFYKNVFLDVYLLSKIVEGFDYTDKNRISVFGESQGGALSVVCAALNPAIRKSFIIYPFLSDYKKVVELKITTEAYSELYRYFKFIDPFHEREEEILTTLSYIDVKNFAHRIKGEVMFIASLMDDVCPPETQIAVYNNLECEKKLLLMPEYLHEALNVKVQDKIFNFITGSRIE